jgi:putative ABC transport system substrate-binding protein
MRRRDFIGVVGSAALTWPHVTSAQRSSRPRFLAVLMSVSESDPEGKRQLAAFTQRLADLGWTEGSNLRTEVRWGSADVNLIRRFATELVALQPDVILSHGTPVTAAFQRETRTLPIVFVTVTDPVGDGFVKGLAHPGGNITGFLTSEAAISSKMLNLLIEIAPGLKRVSMLFNPDTAPGGGRYYYRDFEATAPSANIEPIAAVARSVGEIEAIIASAGKVPNSGIIVMPDYYMLQQSKHIILFASQYRVPTIYPWRFSVARDSGLLSYGPDLSDIVRRGAEYVDRIFRGAKPADLPVQVPVKWEMAVNARTAKSLGLSIPISIRLRADEMIE